MHEQTLRTDSSFYRANGDVPQFSEVKNVSGADVHYLSAYLSFGMKDYANAELSILSALGHLPDDAEILALYVEILWAQDKHEQAREALEKGLAVVGHHYQLLAMQDRMRTTQQ